MRREIHHRPRKCSGRRNLRQEGVFREDQLWNQQLGHGRTHHLHHSKTSPKSLLPKGHLNFARLKQELQATRLLSLSDTSMSATQWEDLGKRAKITHQGTVLAKVRREAGTLSFNENDWGKQRLDPLCIFADVFAEGKFAERAHMSTMWPKASEDRIWELIPLECWLRLHLSSLSQIVSSQKKSGIYSLPYLYRSSSEQWKHSFWTPFTTRGENQL